MQLPASLARLQLISRALPIPNYAAQVAPPVKTESGFA